MSVETIVETTVPMREDQVSATIKIIQQREKKLSYLRELLRKKKSKLLVSEIVTAEKELQHFKLQLPPQLPTLQSVSQLSVSQLSVLQKPATRNGEIDSRVNDTMKDNETLDNEIPTDGLEKEFALSCGTKDISGKPIHVTGRNTWRGAPSPMTSKEKIGDDGYEDKFSCSFKEEIQCTIKGEKCTVHNSYITALMYKQLAQLSGKISIDILFEEGKTTGTLYAVKSPQL